MPANRPETAAAQPLAAAAIQPPAASAASVEVEFECGILDAPEHLRITAEDAGPVLVSEDSNRLSLSHLLKSLLAARAAEESEASLETVAFEFLVRVEQPGEVGEAAAAQPAAGQLLRVSLGEFMKAHKLSAEKRVLLVYVLARQPLREAALSPTPSWVLGIAHCADRVITACSDGSAQEVLLDYSSSDGEGKGPLAAITDAAVVSRLTDSPLTAAAARQQSEQSSCEYVFTSLSGEVLFCKRSTSGSGGPDSSPLSVLARGHYEGGGSSESVALTDVAAYVGGANSQVHVFATRSRIEEMGGAAAETTRKRQREIPTLKCDQLLSGHRRAVTALCPLQGGAALLSASLDSTVRIWDVESAQERAVFSVARAVHGASVNCEGGIFATCGDDRRVRIWDMRSSSGSSLESSSAAALLCTLPPAKRTVAACRWSPASTQQLAVTSHDGSLTVFDLRAPGDTLQSVCWEGKKLLALEWISKHHIVCGGSDDQLRSIYVQ